MPYKSVAQRKYMHAQHPEIAAKWDAEMSGKKKGRIKKIAYEDVVKADTPDFNHRAAEAIFNIVSKMDRESAAMFEYIVVSEVLEEHITKNLDVVQNRVNQVVAKRLDAVRKATVQLVSKGQRDGALAFAEALVEFSKVNPYDRGYQFRESDFSRDPGTGRFRTKVKTVQKNPIRDKTAAAMGLPTAEEANRRTPQRNKLKPEEVAAYQDQYRQLGNFLRAVRESSVNPGDMDVIAHVRDRNANETYTTKVTSTRPGDVAWDPAKEDLVGLDARPTALTFGGAAFGLQTALGGDPTSERREAAVRGANYLDAEMSGFANDWMADTDPRNRNEVLYGRLSTGSKLVGGVAPPGSSVQTAARMAQFVGEHGSDAEKVFGPTARKTAYRYRGTSKTPEPELRRAFDTGVRNAKYLNLPEDTPPSQLALRRKAMDMRGATDMEMEEGRKAVHTFLRSKLPSQELYGLQLASGNTPPSEGVIIDRNGQIVDQAVGYGDDHYLPFNLRKLAGLRGGEYIRSRSVGGLTSEDVYTGLMAGAQKVTVVSRSGTFTMTFEEDFKGKRRHNDKALRMTRRYEQILDAVQSQQVDRAPVPMAIRGIISRRVDQEFPGEDRKLKRQIVKDRIEEYKADPELTDEDDEFINRAAERAGDPESQEAKEFRRNAQNYIMRNKGYRFQLDGRGYEAALETLREQFPYYITVHSEIKDEKDFQNLETDSGYVEPGRNRPTRAQAGLYGTQVNPGEKFSASRADYQGFRAIARGGTPSTGPAKVEDEESETPAAATSKPNQAVAAAIQRVKRADAMTNLHAELRKPGVLGDSFHQLYPVLAREPGDFSAHVATPEGAKEFEVAVQAVQDANASSPGALPMPVRSAMDAFKRTSGSAGAAEWDPTLAFTWGAAPFDFPQEAYKEGAPLAVRQTELRNINRRSKSLLKGGNLSSLSEQEMQQEVEALRDVHRILKDNPELMEQTEAGAKNRESIRQALLGKYNAEAVGLLMRNPGMMEHRMQDVHRMRKLLDLGGWTPEQKQAVTARVPSPSETLLNKLGAKTTIQRRIDGIKQAQTGAIIPDQEAYHLINVGNDMLSQIDAGVIGDVELEVFLEESKQHLPRDTSGMNPAAVNLHANKPHLFDEVDEGDRIVIRPKPRT